MANRYFLNIGANWGDTANWSDTSGGTGGFSVPTNLDDVFFDANSGNCTVNASARTALTLNFTGYTNTITMTNNITVSGNVTLGAGMGIAGTGQLIVNTTATLTSNGKTWSAGFTFSGTSQTYTLADNWAISGLIRFSGTTACTINSNTITASGGFTTAIASAGSSGTTNIIWTGGTWSDTTAGNIRNNLTINGNVTISGTVYYSTGTLTYTSGTVTVTGSRLRVTTCTLDLNTLTLNNFQTDGSSTYTLLSDLNINGEWLANVLGTTINGTFNINVSNGLNMLGNISQGTGTTTLNLLGGTWTGTGALRLNTNINGNITISGNVYYNTGKLSYTIGSGTVTTIGSTLNVGFNTTFDVSGITWNNVSFTTSANVYTLLSDINISGTLNNQQNNSFNGAFNINTTGTITATGNIGGTATLNILGGTLNATTGNISCNLNFNGNINIASNLNYRTNTIKYISGVITLSANHTLNVNGNVDTNSMLWNNVTINTSPITFLSDFNVGGLLTNSNNISYNGAFNLNLYGGLNLSSGDMNAGSMTINLFGGTWTVTNPGVYQSRVGLPTVIRGYVTISGNVYFGSTLRFVNGQLNTSNGILNLLVASTFIDCDKINFRTVVITAGTTQTFNKFFNGTASNPTRIQCATAGSTYVVTFQDTFEKIANNVKVSGCTVSRPGQLIINGANNNKGTNTGIRYINQSPNGLSKNSPPIPTQMTFGIGNISDPTMVVI